MMADEIFKSLEFDVMSLVFNKFRSVVTFQPTVATVLSPEVGLLLSPRAGNSHRILPKLKGTNATLT